MAPVQAAIEVFPLFAAESSAETSSGARSGAQDLRINPRAEHVPQPVSRSPAPDAVVGALPSTLKDAAFDWYSMLPEKSINLWVDLESKFLSHFFDDDDTVSTLQLCAAKQELRSQCETSSKDGGR